MKLSTEQIRYIIKNVRDWDKQHIDYIALKSNIEDCLNW